MVCVVEVELKAARHPLMQAGQQAIVVRIALVAEVELTRKLGIKSHVGWQQTELVQQFYQSFPPDPICIAFNSDWFESSQGNYRARVVEEERYP
jgi:hypothetical protein